MTALHHVDPALGTAGVAVEGMGGTRSVTIRESGGTGRPVMLIHGNSMSGATFLQQLQSELGARYRLVAVDLPGHGESAPADDPDRCYTIPGYAKVVADLCIALEMEDAVLVGWSLGGHIALEASAHLPRAAGMVIFGTPPLAFPPAVTEAYLPHPALAAAFSADLDEARIEAFVRACLAPGNRSLPEQFVDDLRRADPRCRSVLAAGIRPGGYLDEVALVADLNKPLAVFHGVEEQLVNGDYLHRLVAPTLWRGAVQEIAGAGHAAHWEQPARFNGLLGEFLESLPVAM